MAENVQFVSVHDLPVGETQDSPCGRISPLGQMSLGGKETQTSLGMLTHSGKQLEIIENERTYCNIAFGIFCIAYLKSKGVSHVL